MAYTSTDKRQASYTLQALKLRADRKADGRCIVCGINPANGLWATCQNCLARHKATDKARRQREIDEGKRVAAEAERRRLLPCREVVINGVTFTVTNSVVTESAGGAQTQKGPW